MLTYTLDIEKGSLWLRTTPSEFALKQPYCCTEAGIFYAGRNFNTVRDYKDSYLLFYTIAGCGIVSQNHASVKLQPGQALLINCRTPQSYGTDPDTGFWTHYWVHLDGSGVRALEDLLIPDGKNTVFTASEDSLQAQFDILLRNLENTSSETVLRISLAAHQIMTSLILQRSSAYSRNQKLIMKTADYIASRCCSDISLPELLKIAGMSRAYYLRLFRQYIGTTPHNYLLSLRITKAKELLEVTDLSIHEIAMETGFSDDASFSTRFSAMAGISPSRYRKDAITRKQVSQSADTEKTDV